MQHCGEQGAQPQNETVLSVTQRAHAGDMESALSVDTGDANGVTGDDSVQGKSS